MKTTPGIFAGLALSMLLAVPALAQNKVTIYTAAPQDLVMAPIVAANRGLGAR